MRHCIFTSCGEKGVGHHWHPTHGLTASACYGWSDGVLSRGWNYSRTSDIFWAFVALVWTKIDMFRQTVRMINVHTHERTHVIATQLQSLGLKLARGYTASKCSSRYLLMKRSRSYCQTVTWIYCETVSQSSHVTAWHSRSLPHPFLVRFVSCFTFLCLTGCSLTDAARLLFIIGYRDGHCHVQTSHPGFARCIAIVWCAFTWSLADLWQIKTGEWQKKIDCARTNCPRTFYT